MAIPFAIILPSAIELAKALGATIALYFLTGNVNFSLNGSFGSKKPGEPTVSMAPNSDNARMVAPLYTTCVTGGNPSAYLPQTAGHKLSAPEQLAVSIQHSEKQSAFQNRRVSQAVVLTQNKTQSFSTVDQRYPAVHTNIYDYFKSTETPALKDFAGPQPYVAPGTAQIERTAAMVAFSSLVALDMVVQERSKRERQQAQQPYVAHSTNPLGKASPSSYLGHETLEELVSHYAAQKDHREDVRAYLHRCPPVYFELLFHGTHPAVIISHLDMWRYEGFRQLIRTFDEYEPFITQLNSLVCNNGRVQCAAYSIKGWKHNRFADYIRKRYTKEASRRAQFPTKAQPLLTEFTAISSNFDRYRNELSANCAKECAKLRPSEFTQLFSLFKRSHPQQSLSNVYALYRYPAFREALACQKDFHLHMCRVYEEVDQHRIKMPKGLHQVISETAFPSVVYRSTYATTAFHDLYQMGATRGQRVVLDDRLEQRALEIATELKALITPRQFEKILRDTLIVAHEAAAQADRSLNTASYETLAAYRTGKLPIFTYEHYDLFGQLIEAAPVLSLEEKQLVGSRVAQFIYEPAVFKEAQTQKENKDATPADTEEVESSMPDPKKDPKDDEDEKRKNNEHPRLKKILKNLYNNKALEEISLEEKQLLEKLVRQSFELFENTEGFNRGPNNIAKRLANLNDKNNFNGLRHELEETLELHQHNQKITAFGKEEEVIVNGKREQIDLDIVTETEAIECKAYRNLANKGNLFKLQTQLLRKKEFADKLGLKFRLHSKYEVDQEFAQWLKENNIGLKSGGVYVH